MARSRPRLRDRHGRGLRGPLARTEVPTARGRVAVPLAASPARRFDELVLDAVEHLEQRWAAELAEVAFAVEEVPHVPPGVDPALDPDVVADETAGGDVPLGRVLPPVNGVAARVVVYRRPLEARAGSRAELAELVLDVVVDAVARLLGRDPDEIDPPAG